MFVKLMCSDKNVIDMFTMLHAGKIKEKQIQFP